MNAPLRILVADDDPVIRTMACDHLSRAGYRVSEAGSGAAALDVFAAEHPDLLLLDVELGDMNGREVLKAIKTIDPDLEAIVISGRCDAKSATEMIRAGAMDFIEKPLDVTFLLSRIRAAERLRKLGGKARYLDQEYANLKRIKGFGESVVNHIPSGLIHLNNECEIGDCNPAVERILGLSSAELTGKGLAAVMSGFLSESGRLMKSIRRLLSTGEGFNFVMLNNRRGDETVHLRLAGTRLPDGMILFLNDITEDYRIRQALILNEKRATLGEFIATVTHGLGNNMMNIIANASGVQDELARLIDRLDTFAASPEGSSSGFQAVKSDVADIRAGLVDYCERLVRRAFEMDRNIKSLFEYGRQQTEIRVPTEINMVMDDAAAVVQSYPCNNVVWVRNLAADLPTVIVNPHKIKDAVVDLMLNAVQAIPAGAAGRVEYETALDPDRRQIMVRIRDTGPGIPPEHRAMMFKAFFTTKRSGTGLGLANVKNVVKQHDGEVGFDCPPGGGTMFQFSLPIR